MDFLAIGSIATFVLAYWGLDLLPSSDIYLIFNEMWSFEVFVPDLVLLSVSLVIIDIGIHHA